MEKNTKVIIAMGISLIVILLFFMYLSNLNNGSKEIADVSIGFLEPLGSGNIRVIEFSDFQCPACKGAEPAVKEIIDEHKEDIEFYYRNFPLEMHENSMIAALAGSCANEQEKFWEYHDLLFANQNNLDKESLKGYAEQLNLNIDEFNECLDSKKYKEEVQKDISDGVKAGVKGTPTFFVNGKKVEGADKDLIEGLIEEEIGRRS